MPNIIKETFKNKSFINFFNRCLVFSLILLLEVIILIYSIKFTQGYGKLLLFPKVYLAILTFVLLFLGISSKELLNIKLLKRLDYKRFSLFFSINLVSFLIFFLLNTHISINLNLVNQRPVLYSIIWWIIGLIIVFSLLFAFFDVRYILYFIKKFKNKILTSTLITLVIFSPLRYIIKFYSVKLWSYSYIIVVKSVYFLLRLFFEGAFYSHKSIGLPSISVEIGTPCSGIEGIGLFVVLFTLLILTDYKHINKKRVFILYPLGIFGAFLFNILRIFSIIVVGNFTSQEFAIGVFHSNIGWILFTIYFLAFVFFTYSWIKEK